jgi:uncharacterized protein YjiS (DUF1127 family)
MAMIRSATRRSLPRFAQAPIGNPNQDEARASENPGYPVGALAVTATVLPGPAKPRAAARLQGEQLGAAERRPGALRGVWQSCLAMIRTWRQRHRQRAELAMMGITGFNDIGIPPSLAAKEIGKGFWRACDSEWRKMEEWRQRTKDAITDAADVRAQARKADFSGRR